MRFPLDQQIVGGYDYDVKTSYNNHHLGVDWKADYVSLYAPKDGKIINVTKGAQGGNTIWFQPTGEKVIIRWLHLSKFLVKINEEVKEGQKIAITGNTGMSTGAHLHEDIWKDGKVTLKFSDTINPHDYYMSNQLDVRKIMSKDGKTIFLAVGAPTMKALEAMESLLKEYGADIKPMIQSKDL